MAKKKKTIITRNDIRPLLIGLLLIGAFCFGIAAILSYQLAHQIRQRPFPVPREVTISLLQNWMTIRYISHSYKVPEEVFIKKLKLSYLEADRKPLEEIAEERNQSPEVLKTEIKKIITEFQVTYPRPEIRTF